MSYGFPKKKAPETFILRLSTGYGLTLPWTDLNETDKISRAVCDTASVYRVLPKMVQCGARLTFLFLLADVGGGKSSTFPARQYACVSMRGKR